MDERNKEMRFKENNEVAERVEVGDKKKKNAEIGRVCDRKSCVLQYLMAQ